MITHILKIHPQFYQAVKDGSKTFEIRNNDRGFQKGDEVILREWAPHPSIQGGGDYTQSPSLAFMIGYVLPIDAKTVVFSLVKHPVRRRFD